MNVHDNEVNKGVCEARALENHLKSPGKGRKRRSSVKITSSAEKGKKGKASLDNRVEESVTTACFTEDENEVEIEVVGQDTDLLSGTENEIEDSD